MCSLIKPNLPRNVVGREGEQVLRTASVAKCRSVELFVTCTNQRPNMHLCNLEEIKGSSQKQTMDCDLFSRFGTCVQSDFFLEPNSLLAREIINHSVSIRDRCCLW